MEGIFGVRPSPIRKIMSFRVGFSTVPKLETRAFLGQVLKKHEVRTFEIFALTVLISGVTRGDTGRKEKK